MQSWDDGYIHAVLCGDIPSGEWVYKACARHVSDMERECAYVFDEAKALKAIRFIELLPHTKGKWAAKRERLRLEPWQRFAVGSLFGWVHKVSGLRRFREAYIEVARKNGKSQLAAGIGLYMLVADGEHGAEVYSGATTEKQAWEVFRPARLMAKNTPALLEHYGLEVNASNLLRLQDLSRFEPLIGNPGDGASPSCAIIDEYHEHKSSTQYDTMQTGMGSREQPLLLAITTAGANIGGPCYEKRLEAQKVLGKVFDNDGMFALIYTLDPGDDWRDEKNWIKANPNLGVSLNYEYLAAQVAGAIRSPAKQSATKTKHFNQWVGARNAWVNMEHWHAAGDSTLTIESLGDAPCIVALDLATRIDLAVRGSLFYRDLEGVRHYYWFPHFYLPEGALLEAKNSSNYEGWAAAGHIELMDGEETSYAEIEEQVKSVPYAVSEVVYDPWQATQMAQNLRAEGVNAVEIKNITANMSPGMKELEGALASGRFHHDNNPVMTWCASNVTAKPDAKDNVFPRKELPENKIDGMVALIMAMGRALHGEENTSVYNRRGIRTL